ncbi:MAG: biotin/lipoyl-containing protein [Verrucomicrobiota bacterium]
MKKIRFTDVTFRDGFQSMLGARVKTEDFLPAFEAAVEAGIQSFEVGGGARFQSLYFYCQEDAFEMMDACRKVAGPDINLQSLGRGANVVGLVSQCREIIDLHAKMFHKHGISTIRNFDALNDYRNLDYSGRCIKKHGAKHQVCVSLMGLPPGLDADYPHSAKFYADCLKNIIEADIPFDSVCYKDASGTTPPSIVHESIKLARDIVGKDIDIEFHSHCTAGAGPSCLMAAIEGGADIIDTALAPLSGGTCHADLLSMWHLLRGTEYTFDMDYEKILQAEEKLTECMDKYFMPPEAKETNPLIVLSPMPGGALTANTQMMRDNNCMHLYNDVIGAMREVVAKGGFGTSVTPVSQFYFQQAFANVTQGNWSKITEGYGKMVLGYFGKTPSKPDPEIVKLASEQLELEPTNEDVHDINDRNPKLGIAPAKKTLEDNGLEATEENIFIIATCGDKGLAYLQGNSQPGVRYKDEEERKQAKPYIDEAVAEAKKEWEASAPAASAAAPASGPASYTITVNGQSYNVDVAPAGSGGAAQVQNVQPVAQQPAAAPQVAAQPVVGGAGEEIKAPMPGNVLRIEVGEGEAISDGQTLMVLEAMKMETPIKAHITGTVANVHVEQGDNVESGQVLAVID